MSTVDQQPLAENTQAVPESAPPFTWEVDPTEVIFHGRYAEDGTGVIVIETPDGYARECLYNDARHSPTGFSWGYGGSGAADTARCLLLASVDDRCCLDCAGHRMIVLTDDAGFRPFDPATDTPDTDAVFQCVSCDDGLRNLPYQEFKFAHVVGFTAEWRLQRSVVRRWLTEKGITLQSNGIPSSVAQDDEPEPNE